MFGCVAIVSLPAAHLLIHVQVVLNVLSCWLCCARVQDTAEKAKREVKEQENASKVWHSAPNLQVGMPVATIITLENLELEAQPMASGSYKQVFKGKLVGVQGEYNGKQVRVHRDLACLLSCLLSLISSSVVFSLTLPDICMCVWS